MTSHFLTYSLTVFLVAIGLVDGRSQNISLVCEEPTGCAPHGIVVQAMLDGTALAGGIEWNITTPSGSVLISTANPYVAIFNQAGTYDVSVTSNGQTHFFGEYITVFAKPTAAITTADNQGCLPFCTTLIDSSVPGSGAIVSRSWDFGDGNTSTDTNPNHCYEQTGSYTPVLAIADENGCFASISSFQLITVTSNFPNASFSVGSQSSCFLPTAIEFTANNSPDVISHQWTIDSAMLTENNTVQSVSFDSIGTYTVCLSVENSTGCADTLCQSLLISDSPEARFTFNRDTICAGQTISFNNHSVPLPTQTQWDFTSNGTIDANQTSTTATYSTPGSHIITMIAHYGNACTVAVQDTLVVSPNPTMDFTSYNIISCSPPLTSTFTNTEAFNPAFEYIWTVNGELAANTHNLTYTFTEYGFHDIRLRRFNDFGCERSRNKVDIVQIHSPDVSFDYEETYCVGEAVQVSNITAEEGGVIIDYSWDFNGDGQEDAVGPNPVYILNESGEFYATLTATLDDGCVSIDTTETPILVLESVIPGFSASLTESCAGESFSFCTEYNEDNTYTWDFHDGSSPEVMLAIDSCVTHLYEDTGRFDVTLTVFNGACNTFLTIEDYIHIVPPLALFEFEIVCENYTALFHDLSIGGDSLVWDFGDGSPLLINESNPTHAYSQPGQYSVVLTAFKEGSECYDTKTLEVAVAMPSADILLSPSIGCAPMAVTIDNENNNHYWDIQIGDIHHITVERNNNPFSAAWTITHEQNGSVSESTSNDPSSFNWPVLEFTSGGSYDMSVSVIDAFGCEAETTYTDAVVVWPGGDFSSFTSAVLNACDSGGVTVSALAIDPSAISHAWTFSDGATFEGPSAQHRFTAPFNYDDGISCTLTVTDINGCLSSRAMAFDAVLPAVPAFTWLAPPVCRNQPVVFTNNSNGPAGTTFVWDFGDGENSGAESTTEHSYNTNGAYSVCLTATNPIGCSTHYCTTDSILVYSPDAAAVFTTDLNTCLYSVSLENTTVGPTSYAWWNFGDYQTGVGDTVTHTYPIGVYDITFVVGALNGCADTLIIEDILNYASSVGPFTQILDSANCAPFGVSFLAFNPNDQLFDYFWDFNDGNGDPLGGTQTTHDYTAEGAYCPSLIMTDPNGCDVYIPCSDSIFVVGYSSVAIIPEHICSASEAIIQIENAESLSWEHPWVIQGPENGTLTIRADSSFNFLLTSNYSDCVHIQDIHVEVLPLPGVQLELVDSLCANSGSIPLMGGMPVGGVYELQENVVDAIDTHLFSGDFARIQYEYVGENGCSNAATDSVFIIAPPHVDALLNRSFCAGDSTVLFAEDTLSYYTVDGITLPHFEPIFTGETHEIIHHVNDAFGCYNSSSAHYFVHALPTGTIHASDFCANQTFDIAVEADVADGSVANTFWLLDTAQFGTGQAAQGLTFTTGGEHHIAFTIQSDAGCMASVDSTFMIYDEPVASFSSSIACEKDTTLIADLSTFGNDSIAMWTWSFGGIELSTLGDTAIVFTNPGVTPLHLMVTTAHGCSHQTTRDIIVRYAPVVSVNSNPVCVGEPSVFESQSSIPSGGVVGGYWMIEGAPLTMEGNQAQYQFTSSGNVTYTFTAESNFGCSTTVTDSVDVYALPNVHLPTSEYEFCENQEVGISADLSIDDSSQISSVYWLIDGEIVSNTNPAHITFGDIGAYVLDVVATSNHGCENRFTLDQPIVVYPNPTAGFTWTIDQSTELPSVLINASTSADVVNTAYNWGDGTGDELDYHQYSANGSFEITQVVTNSFGCNAYHSETIEAYNGIQFYIPSAFTPDQNNHNETFMPVVTGSNITLYVFRVFNRWGNEIFTTSTPGEGWNGYYNGEPVQDGAYSWSVDIIVRGRPAPITKKGSVVLLR
jgi:gliding motility-associated-like protein